MCSISSGTFAFCRNISYTFFRISYTCRKHVSGTFEKCGPFFYLGVAQLEKLFSYLNENMLSQKVLFAFLPCSSSYSSNHKINEIESLHVEMYQYVLGNRGIIFSLTLVVHVLLIISHYLSQQCIMNEDN